MKRPFALQPEYESYLLRLWQDKTVPAQPYRIMLQHVTTQQQHFFTDLPTLLAFLTNLLDDADQTQEQRPS